MPEPLTAAERAAALPELKDRHWGAPNGRDAIAKRFRFRDFAEAWGFMSAVAISAERLNHHPEWSNVYGTVEITLTTHSAKGLTALDLELADRIDHFARDAKTEAIGASPA
ncbi:MAG: 4a-hydroxytetrahydrobiopterin dehydratase [Paracoccaceae bacterium]|jgi:4a-hydroxytetrahydrobiopterin dehydratase